MNLTINTRAKIIAGAAVLLALAISFGLGIRKASANPSQFVGTSQTAVSTTSPVFMTPGTATSTLVHDTYLESTGNNYLVDQLALLVRYMASSTTSVLNVSFEYSNGYGLNGAAVDCESNPTGCDWYQDTTTNVYGLSTSTNPINVSSTYSPAFRWQFASSTVGGQSPGAAVNWDTRIFNVPAPTRYVRAVFTCAIGGTNCAVWAQFVPAKEVR